MMSGAIDAATLRSIMSATSIKADEFSDYQISAALPNSFVGVDRSRTPTLIIPLSEMPKTAGRRGGGFVLAPAARVRFDYDGRSWEQSAATVKCIDVQMIDAFLVLVADIATRLASTKEVSWSTIVQLVDEWQELLSRRTVLTSEQQLGLWGELWFIANASEPDKLLSAWRGPEGDPVDFFLEGLGLEVKTSRLQHCHHVSAKQLDRPVGDYATYLLSFWVGVDPVGGVSLPELVDRLMTGAPDAPALLKTLGRLGYTPLDRDNYATRLVPLEEPRWFRSSDVPAIHGVDPGITQIRYVVNLDIDASLDAFQAEPLWTHFCGGAPMITRQLGNSR